MAGQGLSDDEVRGIREALAAGRRPKVVFTASAGQVAGQVGQVVELTDPAVSDEFVVVRFGRDELPFSPGDVAIAPKGAGRRPAAEPKPEPPVEPPVAEPEFVLDTPRVPAPRREEPKVEQQVEAKPAVRRAVKAVRPKSPAGLTVTLAYAEGEWTVAAQQGAKALAKPYVVKPAEALRMVALVDVPGVQEAVEQILAAERAEAEQQAEKLRAELAEIEARLAELRDAR
ncbi:hypothetical protein [Micromonospora coxensis]|uniref:hypothetical protein n=1 Tax=Micromonospora coxensis TaxID=356852 RepID=UPI003423A112